MQCEAVRAARQRWEAHRSRGRVSPTRRGALVNWLWNQDVKVMNSWTDAEIERAFDGVSRALGAKVIEVKIEAKGLA